VQPAGQRLVVYVAPGCHLCEVALDVIESVRRERRFELEVIDITGNEELEGAYRIDLPVGEIDGERVFRYEVTPADLRERLGR